MPGTSNTAARTAARPADASAEHRHIRRIDEPRRKEAHALRLEIPVLRQVPRVPTDRRLRHLQLSTDLANAGARSKAQVPEDLTPSRVREAPAFSFQVDLGAFAGHGLLQGTPQPAGHLTPPDTPGRSARGLAPASGCGSPRP